MSNIKLKTLNRSNSTQCFDKSNELEFYDDEDEEDGGEYGDGEEEEEDDDGQELDEKAFSEYLYNNANSNLNCEELTGLSADEAFGSTKTVHLKF